MSNNGDWTATTRNRCARTLYIPAMQMPDEFIAMTPTGSQVIVRSNGSDPHMGDSIRRASAALSGDQVIFNMQSMEDVVSGSLAAKTFTMIFLAVFAGLALLLASIGIYGVISYIVGQRLNEIGTSHGAGREAGRYSPARSGGAAESWRSPEWRSAWSRQWG